MILELSRQFFFIQFEKLQLLQFRSYFKILWISFVLGPHHKIFLFFKFVLFMLH